MKSLKKMRLSLIIMVVLSIFSHLGCEDVGDLASNTEWIVNVILGQQYRIVRVAGFSLQEQHSLLPSAPPKCRTNFRACL